MHNRIDGRMKDLKIPISQQVDELTKIQSVDTKKQLRTAEKQVKTFKKKLDLNAVSYPDDIKKDKAILYDRYKWGTEYMFRFIDVARPKTLEIKKRGKKYYYIIFKVQVLSNWDKKILTRGEVVYLHFPYNTFINTFEHALRPLHTHYRHFNKDNNPIFDITFVRNKNHFKILKIKKVDTKDYIPETNV